MKKLNGIGLFPYPPAVGAVKVSEQGRLKQDNEREIFYFLSLLRTG